MNYVSFALYGANPKYVTGALRNIPLARKFYPDWTCIFYVDDTVPEPALADIEREGGILSIAPGKDFICKRARRHLVIDRADCDLMLSRDADSRIFEREVEAVNEWLASGKAVHLMYDHPNHGARIMAGMYGARAKPLRALLKKTMEQLLAGHVLRKSYEGDQELLQERLWPIVANDCFRHHFKPCNGEKAFPSMRKDGRFVGEVMNIDAAGVDQPRLSDRALMPLH